MAGAVYSLIEWIVEEPRERSYWTERAHYTTLAEARRVAQDACKHGHLVVLTEEKHVLAVYHDCQEVAVVDDR